MPTVLILNERDPFPFNGFPDQHDGLAGPVEGIFVGGKNFGNGMAVEYPRLPSER